MNEPNVVPFRRPKQHAVERGYLFVRDSSSDLEVVHAFGELDLACAKELESTIVALSAQPHEPAIIVDLTACNYLDSTILTVFVRAARLLEARFTIVVPANNPVFRVIRIVGLNQLVPIFEKIDMAASQMEVTAPTLVDQ